MRIRPIALCLGLGATLGLALPVHAQYDVTVLQDIGGHGRSIPDAINDSGWSVGFSAAAGGFEAGEAVLWSPLGKAMVLQNVGGQNNSGAVAINDAGWSVGDSCTTSSCSKTLLSKAGGRKPSQSS
jgi:hypothetical protein